MVSVVCCLCTLPAFALNPNKSLSQYSRTVWTQGRGLPQDSIRNIAQTTDGYLWLGTDEGLASFDGYEFTIYNQDNGDLPANSVTALAASHNGGLWIGTPNGLTLYRNKQFRTFTTKQGLPDNAVTGLFEDHEGTLWIVAGVYLSRYKDGTFVNFAPGRDIPFTLVRTVCEDRQHHLWIAGFSGVVEFVDGKFIPRVDAATLGSDIVTNLLVDHAGNLWIAGSLGLFERSPSGAIRRYGVTQGLPDIFVRALCEDRDGNIWAGTNGGMARLEGGRFMALAPASTHPQDLVRSIFEDREGDLWVGTNNGLDRYRDDVFTVYGKTEGMPSDDPNTIYQDRQGRIWVGFHDSGLMMYSRSGRRLYTTRNGLRNNEVFSIREARNGDLLLSTRAGLTRMHDGQFTNYVPPDALGLPLVFDALQDRQGRIWLATPGGVTMLEGNQPHLVVQGGPLLVNAVVTLCEGPDGVIWAGTYGKGLWRIQGNDVKLYTMADGLSSDQIRSLHQDSDGTLWIGTFGGGLDALRNGQFFRYTTRNGLLSDNVADVLDDGESLWLSTTRGICRVSKQQLRDFSAHRVAVLTPVNYGVEDGLRSAQCAPGYPTGGGGFRSSDGRLWFATTRGLAVFNPHKRMPANLPPTVHLTELTVDGRPIDLRRPVKLAPGSERIQIRYAAIHLRAPERVEYSYKLEGLDADWVSAGNRRVINYNSLRHGAYRFLIRAELPGGQESEESLAFHVLPQFYETAWFRLLAAALLLLIIWEAYRFRLRQVRYRFALVLEERARLAREIHDTLAQAFVGISSQLDAVALSMPETAVSARKYLDLARKMARHSLTEARRSVMDLRASALEGSDLAAALASGTQLWTAGSGVDVEVDVSGPKSTLPEEVEQHLLRIAQEAVTNTLKHAAANKVRIRLYTEARKLYLRIVDNGRGFEQQDAFSTVGGHFGLLGMRERAERLGGELHLSSHPGVGTEVEVMVPLP